MMLQISQLLFSLGVGALYLGYRHFFGLSANLSHLLLEIALGFAIVFWITGLAKKSRLDPPT